MSLGVLIIIAIEMSLTCIDQELLVNQQPHDKFVCAICLQFMTHPCVIDCQTDSKHVFGVTCITQWVAHRHGRRQCPLCRKQFKNMSMAKELCLEAVQFEARCPSCHFVLPITTIKQHLSTCPQHLSVVKSRLKQVISEQIGHLQKQINPHLRQVHGEIYQKYVQDWKWLQEDGRNWKWWWWCNQPWWQNKSCPTCNQLWHRYEKEVDGCEERRVGLLQELGVVELEEEVG